MYLPQAFHEIRLNVLHEFIDHHPFATLISHGNEGLKLSHAPLLLDRTRGANGTLIGHLARANPQCAALTAVTTVTALFTGPHAYVSPRWYQTRLAVPTWNYAAVYARGTPRIVSDPERLLPLLRELTARYETGAEGAWSVDELPKPMLEKLVDSIIGFEIEIESIAGKFKLNQNRASADRAGVASHLSESTDSNEREVAALMTQLTK